MGSASVRSRVDQKTTNGSTRAGVKTSARMRPWVDGGSALGFTTSRCRIEVGLRVANTGKRAVHRYVARTARNHEFLRGELGDHFAAVGGHKIGRASCRERGSM